MLGKFGAEGKVLVLTDGVNENVYLSSRNVADIEVRPFGEESAYDILWAGVLVIEKAALESAEPSISDQAAQAAQSRGEPVVAYVCSPTGLVGSVMSTMRTPTPLSTT